VQNDDLGMLDEAEAIPKLNKPVLYFASQCTYHWK